MGELVGNVVESVIKAPPLLLTSPGRSAVCDRLFLGSCNTRLLSADREPTTDQCTDTTKVYSKSWETWNTPRSLWAAQTGRRESFPSDSGLSLFQKPQLMSASSGQLICPLNPVCSFSPLRLVFAAWLCTSERDSQLLVFTLAGRDLESWVIFGDYQKLF